MVDEKLNFALPLGEGELAFSGATPAPNNAAIVTVEADHPSIAPLLAKKRSIGTTGRSNISAGMKAHWATKRNLALRATAVTATAFGSAPSDDKVGSDSSGQAMVATPDTVAEAETPIMTEFISDLAISARGTPEITSRITGDLLDQCRVWIRRFVVVSDHQATIMAAWTLHTYVFGVAEVTPYLHITSPERACGKSHLMEVLAAIAATPVRSGGMTGAALIRTADATRPTIFLDEMDAQHGRDKDYAESILNEGFHKGGVFRKCVGRDDVKDFNVYCPKCFAGIGMLPDTVSSRSIVIEMRRKLPSETVAPFRLSAVKIAALPIRTALETWASQDAMELLQGIEPAPIDNLGDRQNDIAEPLLAIAQLAGDGWLQRLTSALQAIFKSPDAEDASAGATLLSDIRAVFDEQGVDRIASQSLAKHLCQTEGRDWIDWARGKRLPATELAKQLKKFGIGPRGIRIGNDTPKGYLSSDFEDAWARYCPRS